MAFYWSIKSVPELTALSQMRRAEIWRDCGYRVTPPFRKVFAAGVILGGFFAFWILLRFQSGDLPTAVLKSLALAEVLSVLFAIASRFVCIHILICLALPEIRKRIGGLCANCGYDLRATPERCPECGATVDARPEPIEVVQEPPQILFVRKDSPLLKPRRPSCIAPANWNPVPRLHR